MEPVLPGGRQLVAYGRRLGDDVLDQLLDGRTLRQWFDELARKLDEVTTLTPEEQQRLREFFGLQTPVTANGMYEPRIFYTSGLGGNNPLPPAGTYPRREVKGIHNRHYIERVTANSQVRKSQPNTVIAYGIDVEADLALIREGRVPVNSVTNTFTVNGRTYGFSNDHFWPESGVGFYVLDNHSYRSLILLKSSNDPLRWATLDPTDKNPNISEDDIREIIGVWSTIPDNNVNIHDVLNAYRSAGGQ